MTLINKDKYVTDYDMYSDASRLVIRTKKYRKAFTGLYDFFFVQKQPYITIHTYREKFGTWDYMKAYQTLTSLAILNMLECRSMAGRKEKRYYPKNTPWWEEFHKSILDEVKKQMEG